MTLLSSLNTTSRRGTHRRVRPPWVRGALTGMATTSRHAGWRAMTGHVVRGLAVGYLVWILAMLAAAVVPVAFGWRTTVVVSGSMEPAVHVGDLLVFAPEDPAGLKPGRILLIDNPASPGQSLSHRLDAVNPDGTLRTKGDANPTADSTPVRLDQVRGAARLRIPDAGAIALWRYGQWQTSLPYIVVSVFAAFAAVAPPERKRRGRRRRRPFSR